MLEPTSGVGLNEEGPTICCSRRCQHDGYSHVEVTPARAGGAIHAERGGRLVPALWPARHTRARADEPAAECGLARACSSATVAAASHVAQGARRDGVALEAR